MQGLRLAGDKPETGLNWSVILPETCIQDSVCGTLVSDSSSVKDRGGQLSEGSCHLGVTLIGGVLTKGHVQGEMSDAQKQKEVSQKSCEEGNRMPALNIWNSTELIVLGPSCRKWKSQERKRKEKTKRRRMSSHNGNKLMLVKINNDWLALLRALTHTASQLYVCGAF